MKFLKQNIIISSQQGYALYFYYDGKEYSETNGLLTINKNQKIGFDSNFRLASVSKQFIAFSIVNLVNEGLLSYNTNIKEISDNSKTKITNNLIIDTFHEFIWPDLNNNYYDDKGNEVSKDEYVAACTEDVKHYCVKYNGKYEMVPYGQLDKFVEKMRKIPHWSWEAESSMEIRFMPSLARDINEIGFILNLNNEYGTFSAILILILMLLIVNIVLSSVTLFSVMGTNRKTAALVTDIAAAVNLDLGAGNESQQEAVSVSMADVVTHDIAEKLNKNILKLLFLKFRP